MDQFFGRFFGDRSARARCSSSAAWVGRHPGRPKGIILTNNTLVDDADQISVSSSTSGAGRRGLAVTRRPTSRVKLKTRPPTCRPAPFGDSDSMEVGDWVLAVGSPFGPGADRLARHHLCPRPDHWRRPLRRFPSDRRAHQPRQLWRALGGPAGPRHRHQHRYHVPQWRQ